MIKKIPAFILINLIALILFAFFYETKATLDITTYIFDNVTLKINSGQNVHPEAMPTIKVAYADWRREEIAKWFGTAVSDIENPARNNFSYALKDGHGIVTISDPEQKQFVAYLSGIQKNELKTINSMPSKTAANQFVKKWLTYKGRLPWDAKLSYFKPITKLTEEGQGEAIVAFNLEYNHHYEDFKIIDDLIKLEITESQVISYFRQWSRIIGPLDRPKKIITEKEALRIFAAAIREKNGRTVNIDSLALGFYNPTLYHGSDGLHYDVLYPAWHLNTAEGGNYVIDAYDGGIKKRY